MRVDRKFWWNFIFPKVKFASTSFIATVVDYSIYVVLVYSGFHILYGNIVSSACGFLVNFFLQKRFIFHLRRKLLTTFLMSFSFSMIGISFSTLLIYLLGHIGIFDRNPYLTKLVVMGILFFYNFYTKRIAFEKTLKSG